MAEPYQMVSLFGTLNVSMAIIALLYAVVGFIGFWKVGEEVKDTINLNIADEDKSIIADAFLVSYQIGCCASYIIFMADNIKDMVEFGNPEVTQWSVEFYMCALTPFLLMIISVPNMKVMAKFSLLSNLITFIAVVIIFSVVLKDLPDIGKRRTSGEFMEYPLFFGIVIFSISAMGVVLNIEKNMTKPKQMTAFYGTLNVSMTFIVLLYAVLGFCGYWKEGENVKDSITLNLAEIDKTAGKSVQGLYTIAIFISYGLNGMVPVDILWNDYLTRHLADWKYHQHGICITRIVIVLISVICATAIPLFGDVVSLLGAFGMSSLEIMFPAVIHICVHWPNELGVGKWILVTDIIIFILGLLGLLSGTYSSILSITKHLKELRGE